MAESQSTNMHGGKKNVPPRFIWNSPHSGRARRYKSMSKDEHNFCECLPQQRYNPKPSLQSMLSAGLRGREAELKGPANPVGLTGMMG